jgi:hypothetical protein
VSLPELAMERSPGPVCESLKLPQISSAPHATPRLSCTHFSSGNLLYTNRIISLSRSHTN